MSRRITKKRVPFTPQGPEPPPKDALAADHEIVEILGAALRPMSDLYHEASRTEDGLQKRCALVIDWDDPTSRAFYERAICGDAPPTRAQVMTFDAPFEEIMEAGAHVYRMTGHVEPPLRPGEMRAIVLTIGTLTVVRLERDDTPVEWNPVHVSDSYAAMRLGEARAARTAPNDPHGPQANPPTADPPANPHRLFTFAGAFISNAVASFAGDRAKQQTWAVFVFDGWDEAARGVYVELSRASGSKLPPGIEGGQVTVIAAPFDAAAVIAARYYRLLPVEPEPLAEGRVRVVLFAEGRAFMRVVDVATFVVLQA